RDERRRRVAPPLLALDLVDDEAGALDLPPDVAGLGLRAELELVAVPAGKLRLEPRPPPCLPVGLGPPGLPPARVPSPPLARPASDCTRPADSPRLTLFHRTGLTL